MSSLAMSVRPSVCLSVCPSVRPSSVEISLERGCTMSDNRRICAIKLCMENNFSCLVTNVYLPCDNFSNTAVSDGFLDCINCIEGMLAQANCDSYISCGDFNSSFQRANAQCNCLQQFLDRNNLMSTWDHVLAEQNFTYINHSLGHRSCIDHFFISRNIYDFMLKSNVLFHV